MLNAPSACTTKLCCVPNRAEPCQRRPFQQRLRLQCGCHGGKFRAPLQPGLAEEIADLIQKKIGQRPYLVIAKIARKYMDVNRAQDEAVESPDAVPAYRAYHAQLARYVAEVASKYPKDALLIDEHGQSAQVDTIFRGTGSGRTVKALMSKFGKDSIQGEGSIVALLEAKGYRVFPGPQDVSLKEHPDFNGGFTAGKYGSNRPDGIDAIQLEFRKNTRNNSHLSEDVAGALLAFMSKYVPE